MSVILRTLPLFLFKWVNAKFLTAVHGIFMLLAACAEYTKVHQCTCSSAILSAASESFWLWSSVKSLWYCIETRGKTESWAKVIWDKEKWNTKSNSLEKQLNKTNTRFHANMLAFSKSLLLSLKLDLSSLAWECSWWCMHVCSRREEWSETSWKVILFPWLSAPNIVAMLATITIVNTEAGHTAEQQGLVTCCLCWSFCAWRSLMWDWGKYKEPQQLLTACPGAYMLPLCMFF